MRRPDLVCITHADNHCELRRYGDRFMPGRAFGDGKWKWGLTHDGALAYEGDILAAIEHFRVFPPSDLEVAFA